jgi:hypothetical protein
VATLKVGCASTPTLDDFFKALGEFFAENPADREVLLSEGESPEILRKRAEARERWRAWLRDGQPVRMGKTGLSSPSDGVV